MIDFETLKTLDKRNFNNGLIEALKMGLIKDEEIISLFNDFSKNIEKILIKSIENKIEIIEKDEKEKNLRKILNFGHTIGHAIEINNKLLHGEAIARGMLYLLNDEIKLKLIKILDQLEIPREYDLDYSQILSIIKNDKKMNGDYLDLVVVEKIGKAIIKKVTLKEIEKILKEEK